MKYKAVMFDLDGTLLDTLADIALAANVALSQVGRPELEPARYRPLIGQGARWLLEQALGPDQRHLTDRALENLESYYLEHPAVHARPYPGITDLLDRLSAEQIVLAVLSNKNHDIARRSVQHFFGRWHFSAVVGLKESAPPKPDPAAALQIAADASIPPDRWLYVGDTEIDMWTAVSAGMFAVGAGWGFRDEANLRSAGAMAIIEQPLDVLGLL